MATYPELRERVVKLARLHPPHLAERWLRAVASVLADWGGDHARRVLTDALPAETLRGAGTSGLSWERASARCAAEGDAAALTEEISRRTGEPDPVKCSLSVCLIVGLFKECLSAEQAETLAGSLPAPVGALVRETTSTAPWSFRLIPQSYARPARPGQHPGGH